MSQSLFSFPSGAAIIADLVTGSGLTRTPDNGSQIEELQYSATGATTAVSGAASGTTASYTGADIGAGRKPTRAMCTFSITSGTDNGDVVLISNPTGLSAPNDITQGAGSLHITFTETKVDVSYFDAGTKTDVQTINYTRTLTRDGVTKYRAGFALNASGVDVYLPDGRTMTVASALLYSHAGRYCMFESFTNNFGTSTAIFHSVTFESIP